MSSAGLAVAPVPAPLPAPVSPGHARIDGALDGAIDLVAGELALIEAQLSAKMDSPIGPIPQVGAHLLDAGGKRLRPLLAVLAARATGTPVELAVAVAVAGELIHTATLFHDDVVDDGRVRRGRPAARMIFGNGIVVLVGDFCLAQALATVAASGSLRAVQSLAATVTEMAEGEVAQLEGAGNPEVTTADYYRVIDRKTASLIAWCAGVGRATQAPNDSALDAYGRALGRAFQITDDVLDCSADESTAGKSVGLDLREGKVTLPVLYGCEADPGLRDLIRSGLGERGVAADAAAEILGRARAAGGVERARRRALDLADEAATALHPVPGSVFRDALADLARFAAARVR